MQLEKNIKPISYLKAHASELIRDLSKNQGTLIVTHNGEAKVAVQDIRSYERMQETLALLKILVLSKRNIQGGKVQTMEKTFSSMEKRIQAYKHENL